MRAFRSHGSSKSAEEGELAMNPVPGSGIAVTLPPGKVVFWSALVQAAWSQFVQLKDSQGNVVFTVQGASPDGHSPTQIGQGFFKPSDPSGNYTLWLGVNGGGAWSQVIWGQDSLSTGGTAYLTKYVFACEDGADSDFNDTYLQMQWFEFLG